MSDNKGSRLGAFFGAAVLLPTAAGIIVMLDVLFAGVVIRDALDVPHWQASLLLWGFVVLCGLLGAVTYHE